MTAKELKIVLNNHKLWLNDEGGGRADLSDADLRNANLRGANLRYADLRNANLSGANLRRADLSDADLRNANLRNANLSGANLRRADLSDADLRNANLRGANLRYADLDFACWPLWCGSKNVKVDKKIAMQLAAHFCALDCDDSDYQNVKVLVLEFARGSHRAADLVDVVTRLTAEGGQDDTV